MLSGQISFIGNVWFGDSCSQAAVALQPNLQMEVFVTDFAVRKEARIPTKVEGKTDDWIIVAHHCWNVRYGDYRDFETLTAGLGLNLDLEEVKAVPTLERTKPWWQITIQPNAVDFLKKGQEASIPDAWGIVFYPENTDTLLLNLLHEGSRNMGALPPLFDGVDGSIYIKNRQGWTINGMLDRMPLITSVLTLFAARPLSYTSLIGKRNRDVLFRRLQSISNPNCFVCPGPFNGYAAIEDTAVARFKTGFTTLVDRIHNDSEQARMKIILSYFEELYTALHRETRIAFSFQLMEALGRYKGISIKNPLRNDIKQGLLRKFSKDFCPTCLALLLNELKPENDDFDRYIEKAVDRISAQAQFSLKPEVVKDIAKRYRNEVFHGNFFENMMEVDTMVNALPDGLRDNLDILLQAVTSFLGAHFLLGLDFADLIALKRDVRPTVGHH
jgi:hypothetical protein